MPDDFDDEFDDQPKSNDAHTSDGAARPNALDPYQVTADELRQFIERIEHLEVEKKDIAEQIKEVYAESKARGYDTKAIRAIISLRKKDKDKAEEEAAIIEIYRQALNM